MLILKDKKMNKKGINPLLLIGIIGIFTIGSNFIVQLYRAFGENRYIWWTARTMPLRIDETRDSFKVSINGKAMERHLSEGTILALDENGNYKPIVSGDVSVRLNNWNRVRVSILINALFTGIFFGASITLFIIGLVQVLNKRNDKMA
jgi:hypothetical protein